MRGFQFVIISSRFLLHLPFCFLVIIFSNTENLWLELSSKCIVNLFLIGQVGSVHISPPSARHVLVRRVIRPNLVANTEPNLRTTGHTR